MQNPQHDNSIEAARIADVCAGRLSAGTPAATAHGISTDTRTLRPGQAFFALTGPNHDGHDYVRQAVEAGAPVLVVQQADVSAPPGVAVVRVEDTERALLRLAAWHRGRLDGTVLAVTGSYGKSTVKAMVGAVLSRVGPCTVAPASYNNRIGVGLTLLSARPDDEFVVLEMGTNHPGEIDELATAARPHVGVITAIAPVHLEGLGDLEGVKEAKAELIPHLLPDGALVLNADDERCISLSSRYDGAVFTFGMREAADLRPTRVFPAGEGWTFDAVGQRFRVPVGARYNVMNAAAAVCASIAAGAGLSAVKEGLASFEPPPLRYERRVLAGVEFILDCYNSNPTALRAALRSFMRESSPGRKIVVCGDMLELGESAPALHRQAGRALADAGVDLLVAVGELSRHTVAGWHEAALPSQEGVCFPEADPAWRPLLAELEPGDAVLLKGSRGVRLETIVERIAERLEARKEAA
ncbi:MAG: UDP-N-acetylmuramoyl-tripeptide--D-alanyl-D-alanine ligase [Candidatus Brocadiia bacterium]